jgi:site-specific DNA-cytosine methylase
MITIGELFCGIGGFAKGLLDADEDFQIVWSNDMCPTACAVYEHHYGVKPINKDIHDILPEIQKVDVITAGIPCQNFSSAGSKRGVEDESVVRLLNDFVDVIKKADPKVILIEEVPRFRTTGWSFIRRSLDQLGYVHHLYHFSPKQFGIPQSRNRLFIVCTKSSGFKIRHKRKECPSLGSFIGIEDCATKTASCVTTKQQFIVMKNGTCKTMTIGHMSMLQGFPEDYLYAFRKHSKNSLMRLVGNSVCPVIVSVIGDAIRQHLSS